MGLKARRSPRLAVAPTWKDRAIAALTDSVAHWERLRDGTHGPSEGPSAKDCACCDAFLDNQGSHFCEFCPVSIRTGRLWCASTPYPGARDEFEAMSPSTRSRQAEVDYLRETLEMVRDGRIAPPEGE